MDLLPDSCTSEGPNNAISTGGGNLTDAHAVAYTGKHCVVQCKITTIHLQEEDEAEQNHTGNVWVDGLMKRDRTACYHLMCTQAVLP